MEAQAVVDRPTPLTVVEDVTGLAIGVVGHDVEGRQFAEPVAELGMFTQREVVVLFVVVHPPLERADAEGAVVASDGRRDEVALQRDVEFIGRDLATPEAVGEVPERPLAGLGLVTGLAPRGRRV